MQCQTGRENTNVPVCLTQIIQKFRKPLTDGVFSRL